MRESLEVGKYIVPIFPNADDFLLSSAFFAFLHRHSASQESIKKITFSTNNLPTRRTGMLNSIVESAYS